MEPYRKAWPARTIRVFAILNLLMGLFGLFAVLNSVAVALRFEPWSQDPLYYAQAYYIRSAINFVFVLLTLLGGIYLWRVDRRGWAICKVLFFGQIAYFLLNWLKYLVLWPMGDEAPIVSRALGASAGTGNMGTGLQTITGYPVIALIGLKIAFSRLGRPPIPKADIGSAPSPSA